MARAESVTAGSGARRMPLAAAVVCLVVLAVAGARLGRELLRGPTPSERAAASSAEVAGRWHAWPTGRIFPDSLRYTLDQGAPEYARRVGIAPAASCRDAVDASLGVSLAVRGCRGIVRATYLDQLQGIAVTLGVVAFPDEPSARAAAHWFPARGAAVPGLRALGFPGSVVERFGDASRQTAALGQGGPYLVAATVGYADGRPTLRVKQQQDDLADLGPQLVEDVLRPLAAPAAVRCGEPEWAC
ncbi:hypothetical protein [Actinomadura gamaensis]|uniref:Uncharacterized protein n=1 Tax=Actinomadura gamaensis TaxID=1763541 RepID=A0ABV9TQF2_9ACTN